MSYPSASEIVPELIAAYEGGTDDLAASIKGMSNEQLKARPVPGRWSTLEVLCHLSDSEIVMVDRIKRAIAMEKPLLIGYDESRYAAALAYDRRDAAEELATIRAARNQMSRILRSMVADAWERPAVHNERGLLTMKQLVQLSVGHLVHHMKFINEKRRALGL